MSFDNLLAQYLGLRLLDFTFARELVLGELNSLIDFATNYLVLLSFVCQLIIWLHDEISGKWRTDIVLSLRKHIAYVLSCFVKITDHSL